MDMFFIQEYKPRLEKVNEVGAPLHKYYLCKILDTDVEEKHVSSESKGRVFTLIKISNGNILVHKAICVANRLQWFKLSRQSW